MKPHHTLPLATLLLLAACLPGEEESKVTRFSIAGATESCQGVGPMRCLVVNGELFYGEIEGYSHVEGTAAEICVEEVKREEPVPADAASITYRRVPCS